MEFSFLLKGALLGFSIAAPIGPIGVLCIRRTLQFGRLSGLVSGLGAALADTFYGMIAAFGLTFISNFLLAGKFWLHLFGGCFLIFLGLKTFLAKPAEKSGQVSHKTLSSDFISTFFLTMTNPMTIVAFLAIFAGLGLANSQENYSDSVQLVSGIFLGSAFWFLLLSEGVTLFRKKISQRVMTWVNRIAGLTIATFGIFAIVYSLF